MYASVFIFYNSLSLHFVECGVVFMQAVVDEWASSLFRVCIGFLVFSPKLCSRFYVNAWCNYCIAMLLHPTLIYQKQSDCMVRYYANHVLITILFLGMHCVYFCWLFYHNYFYSMCDCMAQ